MTMNRRTLLRSMTLASMAAMAGSLRAAPRATEARATQIPLWPGMPPGGGGPGGHVETSAKGAVSNVATPYLDVYVPERPNGAAMLVAAGGGYKREQMGSEAIPAAQWLAERGVTAFVLAYRLPNEEWVDGALAPLQDAQRAMRIIRSQAHQRGLDAERVGVLGFSAGGHLMGLTATRSGFASYRPVDDIDTHSARPANAALIYPVITLLPPYDHTSTRRILVGNHPTKQESAEWSVETHVKHGCPPVFLTQADDDPISNPENTRIMKRACEQAGVPVEFHPLASGGHGFGMGKPGTPTVEWPAFYETWLRARQMIA
ncbi:alpha/beta hydrolase [Pandoraea sp. ISTKB]|uniref:alpha/beta hydrolase n=1 Tax=Pandoraea sp. ISTKB TaxID=1586708 RepID=UPI000B2E29DC|nr:alpha/beta hydrolase [Pandoraea sp. ISTKB]